MGSLRVRLFKVPVRIDLSIAAVALFLVLWSKRSPALMVAWVVVVVVSTLWHEMAHAAALRAFGYPAQVHLHGGGGATSVADGQVLPPRRHIAVALSGPVAGLVLGAAIWALTRVAGFDGGGVARVIARDLVWVNAGWAAFNLLPMLPLDGGQVVAASLDLATKGRGQRTALTVSVVVGAVVAAATAWAGWWFATVLTLMLVVGDAAALRRFEPPREDDDDQRALADGFAALGQRAWLAAANRATEVLSAGITLADRAEAANLLMWCRLLEGRTVDAVELMRRLPRVEPEALLLHAEVRRAAGGVKAAIDLLRSAFAARPEPATGTILVKALVEAALLDEAYALVIGRRADAAGDDAALIVAANLFRSGRLEDAALVGERCFARSPHPFVAFNLACTCARQGRTQDALAWLDQALELGFADAEAIDADPDLALLRGTAEFQTIRQRARA